LKAAARVKPATPAPVKVADRAARERRRQLAARRFSRYCPIVQAQHQQLLIEVLFADLQRAGSGLAIERAGRFGGDHDRGVQLVDTAAGVLDHAGDQRRAETVAAALVEAPTTTSASAASPRATPASRCSRTSCPSAFERGQLCPDEDLAATTDTYAPQSGAAAFTPVQRALRCRIRGP
jgi:hypothetical protein